MRDKYIEQLEEYMMEENVKEKMEKKNAEELWVINLRDS